MKKAIILHGMPDEEDYYRADGDSESNCHWLPWIQKQLILNDILAQTPELPKPFEPNYDDWCNTFNQYELESETILIGHSCGGGFLLKWLSENDIKVGKVVLVAPWIDPEKETAPEFFDFHIDPNTLSKVSKLTIMYSLDDYPDVVESVNLIREVLPNADYLEFEDKQHFTYKDMGTREFPELLEALEFNL